MTCIVGLVDKPTKNVYIGADSAGVDDFLNIAPRIDSKVFFRTTQLLIGCSHSFRMTQIVRYALDLPRTPPNTIYSHQWMVREFIPWLRKALADGGWIHKENERESGGTLLVGLHGHLFTIHTDFQVAESANGFDAIGCGGQYALGSLVTTEASAMDPVDRVNEALSVAIRLSAGVCHPIVVKKVPEVQTTQTDL